MSQSPSSTADRPLIPSPPLNRMVVAVLALIGMFVALYLLAYGLGLMGSLMCGLGDCAAVQASPYARLGPVPISALGVAGYAAILAVSLLGIQPRFVEARGVSLFLLLASLLGFGYSAYLTYIEAAVLHEWCQWCVVSAIVMTLILGSCLPEVRRLGARS